jgi:hypothetical protein
MLSVIRLTVRLARAVRFPADANIVQAFGVPVADALLRVLADRSALPF